MKRCSSLYAVVGTFVTILVALLPGAALVLESVIYDLTVWVGTLGRER